MKDETRKTLLIIGIVCGSIGVGCGIFKVMDSLEGADRVVFLGGTCVLVIVAVIIGAWLAAKEKAEKHQREMQSRAFEHDKELAELKARSENEGDSQ